MTENELSSIAVRGREVHRALGGAGSYCRGFTASASGRTAPGSSKNGWPGPISGERGPGSGFSAYAGLREAMAFHEKAEAARSPGNDDARLPWNACARLLMENPSLQPAPEDQAEPPFE